MELRKVDYSVLIKRLREFTEEERKAMKVVTLQEPLEHGKVFDDYVALVSKYFARTALKLLFLDLRAYAWENQLKTANINLLVSGTYAIKICGESEFCKVLYSLPSSEYSNYTLTVQECLFKGIYGKQAMKYYFEEIKSLLNDFGKADGNEKVFLYENVTIVFNY